MNHSSSSGNRRVRCSGFGLIELLVVMVIIMILAVVLIPRLTGGKDPVSGRKIASPRERALQTGGAEYIAQINQAIQMYRMDHEEQNPPNLQALKAYGVTDAMLMDQVTRQPLYYDPRTGRVGNSTGMSGGPEGLGGTRMPNVPIPGY